MTHTFWLTVANAVLWSLWFGAAYAFDRGIAFMAVSGSLCLLFLWRARRVYLEASCATD